MGFEHVNDLIGGRASWTVLGLPTEGAIGDRRRISALLCQPFTVPIDATIGDALDSIAAMAAPRADDEWPIAVVNRDAVLLGSLQPAALGLPRETRVDDAMTIAPGTIRPDLRVEEVAARMRDDGLDHVFVTAINGTLFGLAVLEELHV